MRVVRRDACEAWEPLQDGADLESGNYAEPFKREALQVLELSAKDLNRLLRVVGRQWETTELDALRGLPVVQDVEFRARERSAEPKRPAGWLVQVTVELSGPDVNCTSLRWLAKDSWSTFEAALQRRLSESRGVTIKVDGGRMGFAGKREVLARQLEVAAQSVLSA